MLPWTAVLSLWHQWLSKLTRVSRSHEIPQVSAHSLASTSVSGLQNVAHMLIVGRRVQRRSFSVMLQQLPRPLSAV